MYRNVMLDDDYENTRVICSLCDKYRNEVIFM